MLSLSLSPPQQFAPGTIHLTLRIAPHPDNRDLCYGIVSADYERSSCDPLEGEYARRLTQLSYSHLPMGEYTAWAKLGRAVQGQVASVTKPFRVVGPEGN